MLGHAAQFSQLQSEFDETQKALQAAQRLSEQLDKKTEAIAALKDEGQAQCRILPNYLQLYVAFSLKLVFLIRCNVTENVYRLKGASSSLKCMLLM